jgi:hypothetical protein
MPEPLAGASPSDPLTGAIGGLVVGHCLTSVTSFHVADALGDTPQTAAELAAATGANPDALDRMLRLLAAHGVFACSGDRFTHSAASELLRADHPRSYRDLLALYGSPAYTELLGYFDYTLKTGAPAATKVNPGGFFPFLQATGVASQFNDAMTARSRAQVASVVAAYDFSPGAVIADIGGGNGHLLRAALEATPVASGILFDLPAVIESTAIESTAVVEAATAASTRLTLQAGDFFTDPLPAADTYLLMDVLHNWDDEQALAILSAVRSAAPPHARLLVIEFLLADVPGPDWSKVMDVVMLWLSGGRQRTRGHQGQLLSRAGFHLDRVIPTRSGISILEAVPARES